MATEPEYTPSLPLEPRPAARRRGGPRLAWVVALALLMGLIGGIAGGFLVAMRLERPGTVTVPGVPRVISNRLTEESAVIDVAQNAGPAVVEIRTRVLEPDFFTGVRSVQGVGSGFLVDPNGYIVTNNHVIASAQQLKVSLRDQKTTYDAHLVGTDTEDDIAVIKIDAKKLPTLGWGDSRTLKVGQLAIAIGSPLGKQNSVSRGVISGLHRSIKVPSPDRTGEITILNVIQTDALINPGNSGGPLLDSAGQVIGVNFAIEQADRGAGLGLALDGNAARDIADQLIRTGRVSKPYLGISYQMLDQEAAAALNRPPGALVRQVAPGSPGDRAGLRVGDVIIQVNDATVDDDHPLRDLLRQFRGGDKPTFQVKRGDKQVALQVTLGQPPA